ncbi:uncharacterized protein PFL1_04722 [Pseudozyma flocculosa PF-1]|uniref:Related to UTP14 - subunit of U3-containing small subunit processome complex n=2 Tax=Pseudozyma flocculosa TaxID=84751 RepID=A0A5C3F758_9BASI|nr:uncharacterized protein PFL1_04722 [Pseudozyma flocculosa PF-1]EPQ27584.1 hypothetical protein PFL1_04722 [Pseudozyma flocculosa PF-1]SPO39289.1 related to UTP14 - subunit of U3-containing small subunit processome complex [Pseudozyma flocculosa]
MARSSGRSGAGGRKTGANPATASSSSKKRGSSNNDAAFNTAQATKRRDRSAAAAAAKGPTDIADVYDYAVAATASGSASGSAKKKKDKGARIARRAMAGLDGQDDDDIPQTSRSKGKRRADDAGEGGGDDDDDDDEELDSDSDAGRGPIGPKVFDSDDELNAGIEGEDEEIDSDEAFGESDEEKYGDFKFQSDERKRSKAPSKKRASRSSRDAESGEEEDEEEEEEDEDDGDMMDLSRMLESGSDDDGKDHGSDGDDESMDDDDDDEEADDKLRRHINALAVQSSGAKRGAAGSDDEEGSGGDDHDAPAAKRSRRVLSERTEAVPEGEFATTGSSGGAALRLEDFLDPLSGQVDFANVRKSTKALEVPKSQQRKAQVASQRGGGALTAPLPAVLQDKLDRQAAYSVTKDEVQGWAPTIKQIREADHLSFPLQKPQTTRPSTAGLVASFQPANELESEIAGMLEMGGMTEKQLAEQEDLAMNRLDPEEIKARRAELRRMRDLMFRAEQKAKRVKKIKSKAYRKVHRKERERLQAKMRELGMGPNGEQLDLEDSEGENEERLRAERDRAMERATLKHKNTSKWAKHVLGNRHGAEGKEARDAIEDQLRRGEQLRRRIQARGSDDERNSDASDYDDDDDYDEGDDDHAIQAKAFDELATLEAKEEARRERDEAELERAGGKKGVYNMKFMKDARERQAKNVRGMVDDFKEEMAGLVGGSDVEGEGSDGDGQGPGGNGKAAATLVGGNRGRAMYGTGQIQTAAPTAGPSEVVDETAAGASDGKKKKKANKSGDAAALVEIGGEATKASAPPSGRKGGRGPGISNGAASSAATAASINPFASDSTPDAANPWLAADGKSGSGAVSSKKNAILVGKGSNSEAKAASRMRKDRARGWEATEARREDEEVDIDLSVRLDQGNDDDDDDDDRGSVDEPRPINPSSRNPSAFQQRDLVSQAFAGDDVQTAFTAEKAALIEAEAPKEVDTTLPGWGSWGGKGVKAKKKRNASNVVTLPGLEASQRRDAGMAHVVINEKKDKKAEAFRVKDLPRPFTSRAQYEMAMRNPLGPEWNTRIEHQRLNMPRVTKKLGKVIKPIERKF